MPCQRTYGDWWGSSLLRGELGLNRKKTHKKIPHVWQWFCRFPIFRLSKVLSSTTRPNTAFNGHRSVHWKQDPFPSRRGMAKEIRRNFLGIFFGGRNQVLKVLSWPPLQQHWHSVAKEWRSRSDFNYQRNGKMFFPGSNGEWVQKRNIFKVSSQLDLKNSPFSFRMIKPIHGPDGAGMFYNGCCSCILNRIASMRFIMVVSGEKNLSGAWCKIDFCFLPSTTLLYHRRFIYSLGKLFFTQQYHEECIVILRE